METDKGQQEFQLKIDMHTYLNFTPTQSIILITEHIIHNTEHNRLDFGLMLRSIQLAI